MIKRGEIGKCALCGATAEIWAFETREGKDLGICRDCDNQQLDTRSSADPVCEHGFLVGELPLPTGGTGVFLCEKCIETAEKKGENK